MRLGKLALLSFALTLALPAIQAAAAHSAAQPEPQQAAKPIASPVARPEEQDPPDDAPDPGVATLHVTAREVDVDVTVTDAHGQPIHGLQQSDFSVEENGRPQSIRSFREFSSADPVAEPPSVKLPPGVYTNSHAMPASGPVNIFLLDALNSGFNIFQAKRQITDYLRTMSPGTRIAIFWLSETGLHALQPFTSDREALLRAMETNRLDYGAIGNRWTVQKTTAQALNQIAVYVSGIKGRKNLFWFTPGMPVDLMRDGGYGWQRPPDMSMVHRLMDTYELLTASQVAVYPVDPRGIVGLGFTQLKVEQVAEDFGTDAIFNTNDLTAGLGKLIANGSEFYSLSYIPPNQKYDGHYHHIQVTLDRPGLKLAYRKGYNAERLPTVDHPSPGPALMKASMEGNAPAATQLLFDVGVWPGNQPAASPVKLPGKKQPKPPPPTVRYEVHYGFPASQIAFAEQPDGTLHGAVEFDIVAYDINRARVALLTQTVNMPLTVGQYDDFAAAPFRFTQQIDLPPGQISLHVGMMDKTSNKVGTLEIPLNVIYDPQRTAPAFRAPYVPCPPRCPIPSAR